MYRLSLYVSIGYLLLAGSPASGGFNETHPGALQAAALAGRNPVWSPFAGSPVRWPAAPGVVLGEREFELEYASSALWSGAATVVVRESYAYCAFTNGLLILDIANPDSPEFASQTYLQEGYATDVALDDHYAFVTEWGGTRGGSYRGTLYVVDISSPISPKVVGKVGVDADAYGVAAANGYAYVGTRAGLNVIDVSDPKKPACVANYTTDFAALKVRVAGDYAFVASVDLRIFDVSEPTEPALLTRFSTPQTAVNLFVADSLVYVADADPMWPASRSALTIVDVTTPDEPFLVSSHDVTGDAINVVVSAGYAYVGGSKGLFILNVGDPSTVTPVGHYPSPGYVTGIGLSGDHAVVASFDPVVDDYETHGACDSCYCSDAVSNEPRATIKPGDLQIVDVSDKTSPCAASIYPTSGHVSHMAATDDYAYVIVDQTDGDLCELKVLDISSPDTVQWLASVEISGQGHDAAVWNNHLFIAGGFPGGLQIYDISNPANPQYVGDCGVPGRAYSVAVRDGYAYVAAYSLGLLIIDILDPSDPQLIGQCSTPYAALDVELQGAYAYVVDGDLRIIDISDPEAPALVGSYPSPATAWTVEIRENIAYINDTGYLVTLNISHPDTPVPLDSIYIGPWLLDIALTEDHAVATNGWDGLLFVDISDPSALRLDGYYDTPGFSNSVVTDDEFAYVADNWSFVRFRLPVSTAIDGPRDRDVLPVGFQLLPNYPNPFNASTTIQFLLPEACDVEIGIYNVLGQTVKTLVNGAQRAGRHSIQWNGRDARGRLVSSGVYLVKMRAATYNQSKKIVLLK